MKSWLIIISVLAASTVATTSSPASVAAKTLSRDGIFEVLVADVSVPTSTPGVDGQVLLQGRGEDNHPGTEIALLQDGVPLEPVSLTLADGAFSIDLELGSYQLQAAHPGWLTQRQAFVIEDSSQRVGLGIIKLRSGDSDGDNDVDSDDLRLLRRHLGNSSTASALSATNPVYADVNDDGATDILDLAYAAMNLGRSGYFECPAAISGDSGGPQITGVSWEMHPNNSLIFNFGVDMGTLAQVWAEYQRADGKGDTLQTALTEDAATHHDVSVMRLRANTNYCFQVFAKEPDLAMPIPYADASRVSDSVPGSFRTGPLPFGLVDFSATPASGEQTYDLTLLDNNRLFFEGYVAIDKSGTVVWYYQHDALVFAVDQKDNYNLVFGELGEFASISNPQAHVEITPDGTLVNQVVNECIPKGDWHHESLVKPGTNLVYFLGAEIRPVDFAGGELRMINGDRILVWDQDAGTLEEVGNLFDLLDPKLERTQRSTATTGFFWRGCDDQLNGEADPTIENPAEDWAHSNAIWFTDEFSDTGVALLSIRHLNQILATTPDFQEVVWQLGGPNSDFSFPDPTDRFYQQHAVKVVANGNILLFDNGLTRPDEEGGEYSRALELELDFEKMEARKVWEYRHDPDLYARCCSSVNRLDNGNTVVVFGSDTRGNDPPVFTLVEADRDGNPVSIIEISDPSKAIQYRAIPIDTLNGEFKK